MKQILATVNAAAALAGGAASAATITSLVGDIDGFGGQTTPNAVGADTGFGFNNRTGSDPVFTDVWLFEQQGGVAGSPVEYSHSYSLAAGQSVVSATLIIMESGMSDERGPWDVLVNGTVVGNIPVGGADLESLSVLYVFNVIADLLTGGNESISLVYQDTADEGYAIDYSLLSVETVPLPASLPLLVGALGGLGLLRRRRPMGRSS
ncbi:MAG: VPLPA-CTERM sorting domain-containing protein [Gammaproteobacteria bacterium]|nr:VPLPA-CTERM sorting domain-containing protein [Gammaproteobacteria bacterium]